MPKNRLVNFKN